MRPDTKPKATSITDITPGDRKLTVRWSEPPNEGSPVLKYRVQWVNIGGSAGATGQAEVAAPGLTKVISGLINNDAYNVRVQANNEAGWGPFGPQVKAQSFGTPAAVPAPTLSPRDPVPGEANAQVSISWPSTDPNGPPITKYDVFRRTGGGAWNLIATRSGGESRVASDTIPYQGQTVQYVVTATNGGPATSDKANFSSYTADGIPETPALQSVSTPSENYSGNASFTLGDSRSRGYDQVNWRTSEGRTGSWSCGSGCSGGTASNLGNNQQSMEIQACNVAGRCSPWSNSVTYHPFGPTQAVRNPGESHDTNSITFTWNAPTNNGRPITQYEVTGDKNETFGASRESTTIGGLGYDQTRTIRVRAFATDSGWGPWTSITGKTDGRPAMTVSLSKGTKCGSECIVEPGGWVCRGSNCYHFRYTVNNSFGVTYSCVFDENGDGSFWSPETHTGDGTFNSGKFSGNSGVTITVACNGPGDRDARDSARW